MTIDSLTLPDVKYIIPEKLEDARGFFTRTFCQEQLREAGVDFLAVQMNMSFNSVSGTLRGMHFQTEPYAEAKIVQCLKGSVFDVAVDLRKNSVTYKQWVGQTLSGEKLDMLYIPEGFAHGFITLQDECMLQYFMSAKYSPEHSAGVRFDDPAIGIDWPVSPVEIFDKDKSWSLL